MYGWQNIQKWDDRTVADKVHLQSREVRNSWYSGEDCKVRAGSGRDEYGQQKKQKTLTWEKKNMK